MRFDEFQHVLRAAADVVDDELVVIGSQAVLGEHPDAPASLLQSSEVDLYPRNHPEKAEEIDGAIGDGSRFHETYAFYAHGVGPETLTAPAGWQERLVLVEIPSVRAKDGVVRAWCLATHDLVLSKLAAGRPNDLEYAEAAIRSKLVNIEQLRLGIELLPADHREPVRDLLEGLISRVGADRAD